ncbi:hypothetical protein [Deinococcus pimensis]|uniref:hypothetical protein n=1 Tax=Deinococcus pimensis TaxID=309888 RepID=UPI00146F9596|nr:hypothetical protein [Deinococcus pimensis]
MEEEKHRLARCFSSSTGLAFVLIAFVRSAAIACAKKPACQRYAQARHVIHNVPVDKFLRLWI